jgi:hypothetical protein
MAKERVEQTTEGVRPAERGLHKVEPAIAPGKLTLTDDRGSDSESSRASIVGLSRPPGEKVTRDVWSPSSVFDALGLEDFEEDPACRMPGTEGVGKARAPASHQSPQNGSAPPQKGSGRRGGSEEMWSQLIGEKSTSVGKMGRVDRVDGTNLRRRPIATDSPLTNVPFNSLVQIQRRTEHGWAWVVVLEGAASGQAGFVVADRVATDLPEPTAHLHWVTSGERLGAIAERYYGKSIGKQDNERLFVQAIYEANRDRAGVYLDEIHLPTKETWHRTESAEESIRIFKSLKVKKDHALWIPSEAFVQSLKQAGGISDGRSTLSHLWEGAKEGLSDVVDAATYGAGFLVGILEGAWKAVVDLFKGAADMLETVGKTVLHAITGNLAAIKQMATDLIGKLQTAWEQRGEIADAFLKKWNASEGWNRGTFQGEVIGWVIATVLIAVLTMGEGAIATALGSSTWGARFLSAIRTADALGDVTTYARGLSRVIKLPEKAVAALRTEQKLTSEISDSAKAATGPATLRPDRASPKTPTSASVPAHGETIAIRGYAQGPRLKWTKNPNGTVRSTSEAIEIARQHGVEIPDDLLLKKLSGKYLPDNTYARYFRMDGKDPTKMISWDDFYDKELDELLVHIEESVFHSDEAIVAIFAHEMHEINNLRLLFEGSGGSMTVRRLHYLISPGIKGNLHDQAWDVADAAVTQMRKGMAGGAQ